METQRVTLEYRMEKLVLVYNFGNSSNRVVEGKRWFFILTMIEERNVKR